MTAPESAGRRRAPDDDVTHWPAWWSDDESWPDDAALGGLPENVVEPGDGGCDTDDRDDAHAGRKESTPAGRSLR